MALLPIERINRIFSRHYGSKRVLAREMGISFPSVTHALRGNWYSHRIHEAADKHARQYLATERAEKKKAAQTAELNHRAEITRRNTRLA